jgi:hypothetical protein
MLQDIKPGDLVMVDFKFSKVPKSFVHYGIVAYDTKYVYHFDVEEALRIIPWDNISSDDNINKNKFRKTKWKKFVDNGKSERKSNEKGDCAEIVIERAKILEGLKVTHYSILKANCEHTSLWCKQGYWHSTQVESRLIQLKKTRDLIQITRNLLLVLLVKQIIVYSIFILLLKLMTFFKNDLDSPDSPDYNFDSLDYGLYLPNYHDIFFKPIETYYDFFTFHKNYNDDQLCISGLPKLLYERYQEYKKIKTKHIRIRKAIVGVIFLNLLIFFTGIWLNYVWLSNIL